MQTGTGPFKIVRCADPAIEDPVGLNALKYSTTRDFSLLSFAPDAKPTVFHGRPLTISEQRAVRNCVSDADKYEAAFVRGLVKVDDLVREDGGQPMQWVRPTDHSGKDRVIPDSVLEEYFDGATVQEIGMVIYYRSFLARTPGAYFPLPDICRAAAQATLFRRAVRMNDSSSSAATKPAVEAPPATTHGSSPAGDESTGATATA